MKTFLLMAMTSLLLFTAGSAAWYVSRLHFATVLHPATTSPVDAALKEKLHTMAARAKTFTSLNHFNTGVCFLVDMSIASGKQRFFVCDLKNNHVLASGLVTHGRCNQDWLPGRKYSNTTGAGCTSLGKYRVGNAYQGKFGLAYKLYGLDDTNSNAYTRFVVLHSMQCVPEKEVDPYPICQSDGCPTISPGFLAALSPLIDQSREPLLLWIFD